DLQPATDDDIYGTVTEGIRGSSIFASERIFETAVDIDCDGRRDVAAHSRYGMTFLPSSSPFTRQYPSTAGVPVDGVAQFEPADDGMKLSGCIAAEMGPAGMQADTWATPVYVSPGATGMLSSSVSDAWAGDLNGDGVPEFVTAENPGIKVMTGSTTRRWPKYMGEVVMKAGATALSNTEQRFFIADMDNDGDNDVVWWAYATSSSYYHEVVWFANYGNGTLDETPRLIAPYLSTYPRAIDVADVNGDGWPDVVLQRMSGATEVWHTTGPGVFGASAVMLTPSQVRSSYLQFFDYDADGDLDVLLEANVDDTLVVYVNSAGPGANFALGTMVALGNRDNLNSIAIADLDNDGDDDVVYTLYELDLVVILRNEGGGSFVPEDTVTIDGPHNIRLGDINNDTYPDVCGKVRSNRFFCALYNPSSGLAGSYDEYVLMQSGWGVYPTTFELVDMDGDGMLDLVAQPTGREGEAVTSAVVYYRNQWPELAFVYDRNRPIPIVGGSLGRGGRRSFGDLDGDGVPDFVVVHPHIHRFAVAVYVTAGPGTRTGGPGMLAYDGGQAELVATATDQVIHLAVDDFDSDGDYDVVYATYVGNTGKSTVEYAKNAYGGTPGAPVAFGTAVVLGESQAFREVPTQLVVVDADGDGNAREVVVGWRSLQSFGNNVYGFITLYEVDDWTSASASAVATVIADDLPATSGLAAVDMDLDGSLDLVVTRELQLFALLSLGRPLRELPTAGRRLFLGEIQTGRSSNQIDLAVASLNPGEDSELDIVALVSGLEPVVMMGLPGNASAPVRVKDHTAMPMAGIGGSSFALTDYDSDGFVDVVLAAGSFVWMPNLGYAGAVKGYDEVAYEAIYQIDSSTVADFDRDSQLDFVVFDGNGVDTGELKLFVDGPLFASPLVIDVSAAGSHMKCMVATDVDLDGLVDIIFSTADPANVVGWLPNAGVAPFFTSETLVEIVNTTDVLDDALDFDAAMLDDDAYVDVIALGRDSLNLVFIRGSAESPTRFENEVEIASWTTAVCNNPLRMELGDATGDGLQDVIVACHSNGAVVFFASEPVAELSDAPWAVSSPEVLVARGGSYNAYDVIFADLNGDSLLDVVYTVDDYSPGPVSYFINVGNETHPLWPALQDRHYPDDWATFDRLDGYQCRYGRALQVIDLDMDGYDDILVGCSTARTPVLLNQTPRLPASAFNDTDTGVGASRLVAATRWYQQGSTSRRGYMDRIAVADVDADGFPDWLTSSEHTSSERAVYSGTNSVWQTPRPPTTFRVEVERCGYTMTCVAASVTRWVGQCNGDTVLLPAGRYTGCWRDVPYTVAKSVRLLGEGPGAVLDCTAGERSDDDGALLFRVEGSTTVLKMENMIVLGARTNKAVFGGGSIEVVGGRLELVSVTVTNSTAVTANQLSVASPVIGFGGAVLLRDGGSLVARDSAFVSNTAEHSGGAIAAVGRDVSVVFERVRCVNNHALVSGGCLFLESADGTSFLEIVESVVEDNEAVGRSAAIAYPRRGGGGAVIALAGSFNVSVQRSTISRNVALENGGGLFLRASGEGRISAEFGTLGGGNESVVSDNTALGGSGGGLHAVSLENGETRIVLGSEAIVTANSASGSGGGIAAEAERASRLARAAAAVVASGAVVSSNAADVHGGGVAGSGRGADGQLTGSTLAENRARRIGGAVSAIGGGRMVVDGCVVRDNEAAFGGVGGATSGVDYLAGTATKNGQAIEASSASLEALLIEDEVTLGEGSLYSCAERGGVFVRSSVLMRNSAVHGSVGFGCGSRVSVEGTGSGFEFDVSAKPNGNDVGSGLFFSCLPEGGLCGMAGDPCCLAESPAELRGLPWASASSGMLGAFNQSLDKVQSVVGYGAMAAMPVVSLQWMAGLPELVSSGAPFGSGYGVVTGRDALGQVVVDPQLMLSMEFEDGAKEAEFAFVGSGRQQLMTDAELSFGGVGIAARSGAEVGVPIAVQIAVAQSAIPLELVPDAIVRDSVVVQACLPGSGAIIRPGSTVLECTLCAEGTFSNATSLEPCKICPASTVLTGQGATECLACPENAQVIPGFVPEPGLGLNCSCIPGFWTATGQINVGCEACPEGAKCDGGQSLPVARPGFFPTEDPGVFLECPNAGACKGGFPFRCTEGYTGQLCGACDRGYYALSGSCYKCDNRTLPIFAVVFVLAVCFVGLLVWLNAKEELSYRFAAVMIGFNSLQISAMYGQFELPWSNFASQFFNVVSFFNLNFDLSSPECATVTDDVWLLKWWMTVSLPLLFVVPFAIVYCSVMVNKHHLAPRLGHVVLITGGALRDACRRAYLQLMVLLYLPLAAMAMSYLQCRRDKDGRWVLEAAPAKSCYGTWYWNYFGVAVVFCVVYCLGLPSLVFYLLTRVRSVADPVLFSLRYAFLVGRFSPANYRFEVWIMARKVSVVMAMTFFRPPMTKANVALFALVVSMCQLVRFL
ncbi:uncharacterized protein AMSG_11536, partial [Thecamonas trahens ATCC 50062]